MASGPTDTITGEISGYAIPIIIKSFSLFKSG